MHPEFNLLREQSNHLFLHAYRNPHMKPHFHSLIEIYLADEGEAEIQINGRQERLLPGDIALSLPMDAHGYQTVTPAAFRVLIIPTHLCEEFLGAIRNKALSTPFIRDATVYQQIDALYRGLERDRENPVKVKGYICLILGILLDQMLLADRPQTGEHSRFSQVLLYLNEHYREDLSLESAATALGYNSSYLSRHFKSRFSISLTHYITMLRLREAVRLMGEKKHSITYCAIESGFPSLRTFYRCFLENFHCSPTEYMTRMEETDKR